MYANDIPTIGIPPPPKAPPPFMLSPEFKAGPIVRPKIDKININPNPTNPIIYRNFDHLAISLKYFIEFEESPFSPFETSSSSSKSLIVICFLSLYVQ